MMRHGTEHKSFRAPNETREFPRGSAEILSAGDSQIGRMTFDPRWRWSTDVAPIVTDSCEAPHFQYRVSGQLAILMDDGTEMVAKAGDVTSLPADATPGLGATSRLWSSTRTARAITPRRVDAMRPKQPVSPGASSDRAGGRR